MLNEQVRAAGDPRLQRLLKLIRQGIQDKSDLEMLNNECYQEGRRIPWESGIKVVTPLNDNRWHLNFEATLSFQNQEQTFLRIFISEHKWKDGECHSLTTRPPKGIVREIKPDFRTVVNTYLLKVSAQPEYSVTLDRHIKLSTVIVRYYVSYPTQIDGKNTKGYQL